VAFGMRLFIVFLFIGIVPAVWAQPRSTAPFSPNESLDQLSVFQWTGENGLISNNITSSIQAKTGFIWITTYNGIMRFDGKRVDVYDRKTLPFLSTDAFYKVYEDAKGRLWFASQGSGVITFNGKKFESLDSTGQILPKSIRCLYIDEQTHRVWIGTNNEGLFYFEKNKIYRFNHTLLNTLSILDIDKDANQTIWLATDGHGVVALNGSQTTQFTVADGLESNIVNAILTMPDSSILIGTNNGLNKLTKNRITALDGESVEIDHPNPEETDQSIRSKLTTSIRTKLTTLIRTN
jgi:streptogramin lyase